MEEKEFIYESVEDIIKNGDELTVIEECEFEVVNNEDGTFSLIDLQGADFGNISSEVFNSYKEILLRLEGSYLHDYGFVSRD